jgi:hypothetical protein
MTTPAWPSTLPAPLYGIKEESYLPQIRTEMDANYVQSRPRSTRMRRKWTMSFVLSEAQWATLETFFFTYLGSIFTWSHPVTATTHSCRFTGDNISNSIEIPGYRHIDLSIEEA